jgi:hypothetical protein
MALHGLYALWVLKIWSPIKESWTKPGCLLFPLVSVESESFSLQRVNCFRSKNAEMLFVQVPLSGAGTLARKDFVEVAENFKGD